MRESKSRPPGDRIIHCIGLEILKLRLCHAKNSTYIAAIIEELWLEYHVTDGLRERTDLSEL
jgi:hypothetical protein